MSANCGIIDRAKASFNERVCKDHNREDPQRSVISREAGIHMRRSCSDGLITRQQGAANASRKSSVRDCPNEIDDFDSGSKLTCKLSKNLMPESSSSNSSNVTVVYSSEKKSPKEMSLEAEPSSSVDEKDNRTFRSHLVDSFPLMGSKCANEAVNQGSSGYDSQDEWSNMTTKQSGTDKAEGPSQESITIKRQVSGPVDAMTSSKSTASTDPGRTAFSFDLNSDLGANDAEIPSLAQPSDHSIATHYATEGSKPVAVMAKVGVPNGSPSAPLEFYGKLGWKRSFSTSAFRPLRHQNLSGGTQKLSHNDKTNTVLGFDLNVAPSVDSLPFKFDSPSSTTNFCSIKSSADATSPRSGRLSLNHLNPQPIPLNLNENVRTAEKCNNAYYPAQTSLPVRYNSVPVDGTVGSSRDSQGPFIPGGLARPMYWVDFGSIPGFAHLQGQPVLVSPGPNFPTSTDSRPREGQGLVVPLQSKMGFAPGPHPGYYIRAPNTLMASSTSLPFPTFVPHLIGGPGTTTTTTTVPQLPAGQLPTSSYQAAGPSIHSLDSSNSQGLYSNMGGYMSRRMGHAGFSLNSGVGGSVVASSEKGNATTDRSFVGLSTSGRMAQQPTVVSSASAVSVKRREPAGGWDSFQQLTGRRMTNWK